VFFLKKNAKHAILAHLEGWNWSWIWPIFTIYKSKL
jgi:hypothetical protein